MMPEANCEMNVNATKAYVDLTIPELVQAALSGGEGELAANEALVVKTGKRTGRSPKDRFIVQDDMTQNEVDWNHINQPLSPFHFKKLWDKALNYLQGLNHHFISHLRVGEHPLHGLNVKVMTELAWHQLFANVLFIRPEERIHHEDGWTILSTPRLKLEGASDGVFSDAAVVLNFTERKVLIIGTEYAGEMKKAMFSVLNFLLPQKGILPMHCAANADSNGHTALFFGLSGTGKTTLSADPHRLLIGDDEHGWSQDGIFNFEGGCYAKCIDLSEEREPLIWHAIRFGAVIENVILDPQTKIPDYHDATLTQNTRAAYPREYIKERVESNNGHQPDVVLFLTCDLYGVLPPVAKLTIEQAAYYFLSGYTALVGSTEVGQGSGIKPTFSTCFGAPFFPRPASQYAELLMQLLRSNQTCVYLVNTGWHKGAHGAGGSRFPIPVTRSIVSAIVSGALNEAKYDTLPGFNLKIPVNVPGVDSTLLDPRKNWENQQAYLENATLLIRQFRENFQRFNVSEAIKAAGPTLA